jgi:AmmeMemoRadiSam system protein B
VFGVCVFDIPNSTEREKIMKRRNRMLPRGWYPSDGKDCQREIESYIEGWLPPPSLSGMERGGIVPHAGWFFSGRLAARVFHSLQSKREIEVVVLYGGHLSSDELPCIVMEETWETPLGDMEIHRDLARSLLKRIDAKEESPSSGDNTVEVQLAMVKYFFPKAKLLAIRSPASLQAEGLGKEVAAISLKEGISIVAVGSTDLTHYGPNYGFLNKGTGPSSVEWVRKENDKGWVDRALKMDIEGLLEHARKKGSACSPGAAASAIATCKALGAEKGVLLDYCTSYDILPDDSFVGYAGIVY